MNFVLECVLKKEGKEEIQKIFRNIKISSGISFLAFIILFIFTIDGSVPTSSLSYLKLKDNDAPFGDDFPVADCNLKEDCKLTPPKNLDTGIVQTPVVCLLLLLFCCCSRKRE